MCREFARAASADAAPRDILPVMMACNSALARLLFIVATSRVICACAISTGAQVGRGVGGGGAGSEVLRFCRKRRCCSSFTASRVSHLCPVARKGGGAPEG